MKLIGLIPAAGQAKRLKNIACSKELIPIGSTTRLAEGHSEFEIKPVISYLIDRMTLAGVRELCLIISKEKTDILKYLGSGASAGCRISYIIQEESRGMPDALNQCLPWVGDAVTVFGMPDTIFFPQNAFQILLQDYIQSGADVVLGLFPTQKPHKFGMVDFDQEDNFLYTIDKPASCDLKYMWGIACWGSKFSQFIDRYIQETKAPSEFILSAIFQAAFEAEMKIKVTPFENGQYLDIGTPEDLHQAMTILSK